jgi:hypothetical protein
MLGRLGRTIRGTCMAAGLVACATGSGPARRSGDATDTAASISVVTRDELVRFGEHRTLMDALERLRPSMLGLSGRPPRVSLDGSPPAELSLLRTISVSQVREVRLQRASSSVGHSAIASNGAVVVGDVIVVTTWRGGRGER